MALSNNRRILAIVSPPFPKPDPETGLPGGGSTAVYRLLPNGAPLQIFWTTKGWYAPEFYISDEGFYLARVGGADAPTAPDGEKAKEPDPPLALAFYDRGTPLKKYSIDELVKDKTKIVEAGGVPLWLARDCLGQKSPNAPQAGSKEPRLDDKTHIFVVETCDGIIYQFDITTGSMMSSASPATPNSNSPSH